MKKLEIIFASFFAISAFLDMFLIPASKVFLLISCLLLSNFYILASFVLLNNIKIKNIFRQQAYENVRIIAIILSVVSGIFFSILFVGMLFKINSWPGANFMLYMGIFLLILMAIIILLIKKLRKTDFLMNSIRRIMIFLLLACLLAVFQKNIWVDFKYRNYPEIIRSLAY